MKRFALTLAALILSGAAHAAMPVFAARCPGGITVDSAPGPIVYINGQKARVKQFGADAFEARSGSTSVEIQGNGESKPEVSYSAARRAHGFCQVSGFANPAAQERSTQRQAVSRNTTMSASERAGRGMFDASGRIPCAQYRGQPMEQCQFRVARGPEGSAAVIVTRGDGRTRAIFFDHGKASSADLSQADGNMSFHASKQSDLFRIDAGDEHYEIPEAVVFGG